MFTKFPGHVFGGPRCINSWFYFFGGEFRNFRIEIL